MPKQVGKRLFFAGKLHVFVGKASILEGLKSIIINQKGKGNVKETKNRLTKLDSNFNLIWATDFESSLYEIVENDEIYFVTYDKKSEIYKLITKNGQKRTLSNNDEIVVNIKKNELPNSNIIDLRKNLSFDRMNNSIKLSKE